MSGNVKINFLDEKETVSVPSFDLDRETNLSCLICDKEFTLKQQLDDYLGHLFMEHRLVIADVQDISLIEDYLAYWMEKLNGEWVDLNIKSPF